jgi:hypothetical protein
MAELNRRLTEILECLDANRAALLTTVRDISPAFATMRPRSGAWSAAENVAHLALVEDRISQLVARATEKARAEGAAPSSSAESIMSSLDRFRVADAGTKLAAPATIAPESDKPIEDSLAMLEQTRARLKEALIAGADLELGDVKRPHPALGDLSLYQWALFVAQHEERHRRQIERTLDEVTELAAECAPIM